MNGSPFENVIVFLLLFRRFDETFDLILPSSTDASEVYLHLCVKDRGVLPGMDGGGVVLGEAYLPLSEVNEDDRGVRLEVSLERISG